MAAVKTEGKTSFVKDVLAKNPQANPKAVNDAWSQAGNSGKVSSTLVQKVRAEMGLTGNLRSGRKPGSAKKAKTAKRGPGRPPKAALGARANGAHSTPAAAAKPARSDRTRALDEIEGEIDRLLFKVMGIGQMAEIEEALRRARRLVVLSHSR